MKATSGWGDNNYNGTDDYGFAALPGGMGDANGYLEDVGRFGGWWSSFERSSDEAYARSMWDISGVVSAIYYFKDNLLSVRCLKN